MKESLALLVALVIQITCLVADESFSSLEFIVIHETQFEDSEPIAIKELDIRGFRAEKPDLEVTKLEEVAMRPDKQKWTTINQDGSDRVEGVDDVFTVEIRLDDQAQKDFATVSASAIGKRLLISIGDHPLIAPYVRAKIDTPSLAITLHDEDDAKKVVKALRKLTSPHTGQPDAGHPATRPESKSDGGDKPRPEGEGRSR